MRDRIGLIRQIGRIGPTCLILLVLASSAHCEPWVPLPTFRDADALPLLLSADNAKVAFLMGQIGDRKAVPPMAELLDDPDRTVRIQTGIALASLGDERGIPACASALRSEPTWIRFYAAYGLWQVNTPRAGRILKESLPGQGQFISEVITGALNTPYAKPVSESAIKLESMEDAGDALTKEADEWWHDGNLEQAARCLETILFLDPEDVQSYGLAAWLQWSLGRDEQAINTLKRGIAIAPDDPEMHFELGFHYFNTKRYRLARGPLKKALDLGGDNLIRRQYAHCLEKLGRCEECLSQWEKLLALFPDDQVVKMNYERVRGIVNSEQGTVNSKQ